MSDSKFYSALKYPDRIKKTASDGYIAQRYKETFPIIRWVVPECLLLPLIAIDTYSASAIPR